MKKPVHWFAYIIWTAAALYPITVIFQLMPAHITNWGNVVSILVAVRGTVVITVGLAALAILIEIADQIRWQGLTPEQQSQLTGPSALEGRPAH